jgi:hypothetical protein
MNLWETFAMEMPVPDSAIITRKDAIVAGLKAILPEPEAVISDPNETRAYECDALTAYRCQPLAVVLPATTEEVAAVLKFCHAEGCRWCRAGRARRWPAARCRQLTASCWGCRA